MPKVLFFLQNKNYDEDFLCCRLLLQSAEPEEESSCERTHTMKARLVGLFNGLLLNKTVETVQGSRGKCGNPLLGLGHSGGQSPTGQHKSAVLTTSAGQKNRTRELWERCFVLKTLRGALNVFRIQAAAFDSCLCYVQLNLRKGRRHHFLQTIYMRGHVLTYFVSSSAKEKSEM